MANDTYATGQIDRLTEEAARLDVRDVKAPWINVQFDARGDVHTVKTKWILITPEELAKIRAIFAERSD